MKLLKLLSVLSLALGIGLLPNIANARSGVDVATDLARATDTATATYKEQGMTGLIVKTEECYAKNTTNRLYCIYLDLASRKIDQIFVEGMRYPPTQFFTDEEFGPRIQPVLIKANMDMHRANSYLGTITPLINDLVLKKLLDQR